MRSRRVGCYAWRKEMTPFSFNGHPVYISPDVPRYVLPEGVPQPTGMSRDEFAIWSANVCGVSNLLKDGEVTMVSSTLFMNPRTHRHLLTQDPRGEIK